MLYDEQLGSIRLIHNRGHYLRLNIRTNGEIVVSVPMGVSQRRIERFVAESRQSVLCSLEKLDNRRQFKDGDMVGREHQLVLRQGVRAGVRVNASQIIVTIPPNYNQLQINQLIHGAVARALKKEAEHYLPRRLYSLALKFGYHYQRVRLTFAKSRWGSCSSSGTISLNVGLMLLPNELIDYVLLHELAHTKHMNHSAEFWAALDKTLPGAKQLAKRLRDYSPYI